MNIDCEINMQASITEILKAKMDTCDRSLSFCMTQAIGLLWFISFLLSAQWCCLNQSTHFRKIFRFDFKVLSEGLPPSMMSCCHQQLINLLAEVYFLL